MSKIAEDWKNISPELKAELEELAKQDKERYANEMASYTPTEGFELPSKRNRATSSGGGRRKKTKTVTNEEGMEVSSQSSSEESSSDDSSSDDDDDPE